MNDYIKAKSHTFSLESHIVKTKQSTNLYLPSVNLLEDVHGIAPFIPKLLHFLFI